MSVWPTKTVLAASLQRLVELKQIERLMETGKATADEATFYEANKEAAWNEAERLVKAFR